MVTLTNLDICIILEETMLEFSNFPDDLSLSYAFANLYTRRNEYDVCNLELCEKFRHVCLHDYYDHFANKNIDFYRIFRATVENDFEMNIYELNSKTFVYIFNNRNCRKIINMYEIERAVSIFFDSVFDFFLYNVNEVELKEQSINFLMQYVTNYDYLFLMFNKCLMSRYILTSYVDFVTSTNNFSQSSLS